MTELASAATAEDGSSAEELIAQARAAARAYYEGTPIMSDPEFDLLADRLAALGVTVPVGGWYRPERRKATHVRPMLSLAKVHTGEELRRWVAALPDGAALTVEPKWDGLALELVYADGRLAQAITRGDGVEGEDVTATARRLRDLPAPGGDAVIHGEVVLDRDLLAHVNATHGVEYANTRNAAAGAIRRLDDLGLTLAGYLRFIAHERPPGDRTGSDVTWWRWELPATSGDAVGAAVAELEERHEELPCDVDGAVVKVLQEDLRTAIGYARTAPDWAVAYKFADEAKETLLEDITWATGRTGRVVPRAVFAPVELTGASVTHATLHNAEMVEWLAPHAGDTAVVKRSGDVIPYVMAVRPGGDRGVLLGLPQVCPNCGSPLRRESADLICTADSCNVLGQLLYAVRTLGVDGVGPGILAALMEHGVLAAPDLVTGLTELLDLTPERLAGLPRFGDASIANTVNALGAMREGWLGSWVAALGMTGIGIVLATRLASAYRTLDALAAAAEAGTVELDRDLGPARQAAVVAGAPRLRQLADGLAARSVEPEPWDAPEAAPDSPWRDKRVVLTGTLEGVPRRAAADWLTERGAVMQGGVSSSTDIVVAGEGAGSKLARARELGIAVVEGGTLVAEMNRSGSDDQDA